MTWPRTLRFRYLNIERGICFLVAASFLVWVVLAVFMLSHSKPPKEPGSHSGNKWRIFREDDPNPKFRHRPELRHEEVLNDNDSLKDNVPKENSELKKEATDKEKSVREKLELLHKKKLADAGIKIDEDKERKNVKDFADSKHNPVLDKLLRIHEGKLQKAGIDVNFNQERARDKPNMESMDLPDINYNVHIFYYPWYSNPEHDGAYHHWDHPFLPHWNKAESLKWPMGKHKPPDDIGANYYPALGPYSSGDPAVVEKHMHEIRSTGAGVVSVSWYPPGTADKQGSPPDDLMPLIMDKANKFNLKVTFHIEPFTDRKPETLRENLKYILETYGSHPAFYRTKHKGKELPLYHVYDSYLVQSKDWARLLNPEGEITVRETELDGIFIALLVEKRHREEIFTGGFDGYYTYFASNGFSYGSSWKNWNIIQAYAKSKNLIFMPSVGPGYIDTRVRPWNGMNTKGRDHGRYYESAFESAVNVNPPMISVTSYNEWHEGTQIESAIPKAINNYIYNDYEPEGSSYYLDLTRKWIRKFSAQAKTS